MKPQVRMRLLNVARVSGCGHVYDYFSFKLGFCCAFSKGRLCGWSP